MKRSLKITEKADPTFYEDVGKYIIQWLAQNRKARINPGTQKQLVQKLEQHHHLNITEPMFSRYLHGVNKIPAAIENTLINAMGFRSEYFIKHHASEEDKLTIELLTKEDLYKLILELKLLINEWKESYFKTGARADRLSTDNSELVKMSKKLVDENDKLREQIRGLKKELKDQNRENCP